MKKFLVGCAIVILVIVTIAVGAMIYVALQVKKFANAWEVAGNRIEQVDKANPYTAPTTDTLDPERTATYFAIRNALVERVASNETVQKLAAAAKNQKQAEVGVMEMMRLGLTETRGWLDFFGIQLEQNKMSTREYAYISRVVLRTAIEGEKAGDPEMKALVEDLRKGIDEVNGVLDKQKNHNSLNVERLLEKIADGPNPVAEGNRAIVAKHTEEMKKFPWVAWLELAIYQENIESTGLKSSIDKHQPAEAGTESEPAAEAGEPAPAR